MRRTMAWALALPLVALAAWAAAPPNLTKALEVQRRLATERPEDAAVFNDLGNLLQMAGNPADAETAYRRALELDPARLSARFNLGLLLQQRSELRKALRQYREVIEQQPRHAWAHFQSGSVLEALGQENDAIAAYARAFRIDPQLAFPEVNPQVIDSDLVTQAMMRAYREGVEPEALPPPIYEQPNRIAELLVPPVAAPPGEPGATDLAATPQAAGRPAPRPPTPGAAPPTPGARVLRPGNLQGGSVNQAAPQPGTRGRSRNSRGFVPPQIPSWTEPESDLEGRGTIDVPNEDPVDPPDTTVVINPGLQSTGRLELNVAPRRRPRTLPAG